MKHAECLVDLVDEDGSAVDTKQRQEINKQIDLYHTIFVILRTPDNKLILSKYRAAKIYQIFIPDALDQRQRQSVDTTRLRMMLVRDRLKMNCSSRMLI